MSFVPVVAEIMTTDPSIVSPSERIAVATQEMELSSIRHLPVVDDQGSLVGLLSQRDVLATDNDDMLVEEVMSADVLAVAPETPAHEAAYLLLRHKIGCLPVVSTEGALVGIITETDFVRAARVLLGGTVPDDELELEEHEADRV